MLNNILPGLTAALLLAGCGANWSTIDRSTDIPNEQAKVTHLDAQQRALIYNNIGKFCSEPSPDALGAFASSLGLKLASPEQSSADVNAAVGSAVASIGLRTQSITLMRDALYRICEAYGNDIINDVQAAILLGRSQDLTAVVVAIEQLTGVVTAQQATIGANASSETQADTTKASATTSSALSNTSNNDETATADSIANAVETMVLRVLTQDYAVDGCIYYLFGKSEFDSDLKDFCTSLVEEASEGKREVLQKFVLSSSIPESSTLIDECTETLKTFIAKDIDANRAKLNDWLESKRSTVSLVELLTSPNQKPLCQQAVAEVVNNEGVSQ